MINSPQGSEDNNNSLMSVWVCMGVCIPYGRQNRSSDHIQTWHSHRGTSCGWNWPGFMRLGSRGAMWDMEKGKGVSFFLLRNRYLGDMEVASSNPGRGVFLPRERKIKSVRLRGYEFNPRVGQLFTRRSIFLPVCIYSTFLLKSCVPWKCIRRHSVDSY